MDGGDRHEDEEVYDGEMSGSGDEMEVEPFVPDPELAKKLKEEGNVHFREKRYIEATDLYSKAIENDPDNDTYYANRGAAFFMRKMYTLSLKDCQKTLELNPQHIKAMMRLAKCYVQQGELMKARLTYDKVLEIAPNTIAATKEIQNLDRGMKLIDGAKKLMYPPEGQPKNVQKALLYLSNAERVLGDHPDILLLKGEALIGARKYHEAVEVANVILQTVPKSSDGLVLRGIAHYYNEKFPLAQNHFKQVLGRDPDHKKAAEMFRKMRKLERIKARGNDAFKAGRFEDAIAAYTEALEVDPDHVEMNAKLYCNRATALYRLGRDQQCFEDCNNALELNDEYVKAYVKRGQYEEAVRDFERAKQLDPENRTIRQQLKDAKLEAKKAKRKDYYKILGIGKNATEPEIKKGYRVKALKWHPDKHSDATEEDRAEAEKMFKDVNEAYSVLSDSQKKARYDSGQDLEDMNMGAADMNDIFSMFFGGGGGHGGHAGFSSFGGGGRRRGNPFGGGGVHFNF